MNFVEVKEVPGRRNYHKLDTYVKEFLAMNVKQVRVDFAKGEYKNAKACASSFYSSILRYGFPVDVRQRGEEVYLINRDL